MRNTLCVSLDEYVVQVRPHGRPLGGDDAVDAGVPQCARRVRMQVDLMAAQHTVKFGPQTLDCAAAWVRWALRRIQVDPISRRRLAASTFI